jgi:glycerol kinase
MPQRYIGAVDQGTTSTRFMIFDHTGRVVASHQLEHRQIYPQAGWVEHDPVEIWAHTQEVIRGALEKGKINPEDIAAIGVTNQRETTVVWNRRTGQPYHNAIVWQDTRTDRICADLAGAEGPDRFRSKVGLPLSTYFSGPKIRWLLDNIPGLREAARRGDAIFGTIDTWLIWNLTGGVNGGVHVTDVTNASRTMLMALDRLEWDDDILAAMEIPRAMLPAIRPSSDPNIYGYTLQEGPFGPAFRSAATWGISRLPRSGRPVLMWARPRIRTARVASCLLNTGTEIVPSKHGLLTTVCYQFGDRTRRLCAGRLDRHRRRAGAVAARQFASD